MRDNISAYFQPKFSPKIPALPTSCHKAGQCAAVVGHGPVGAECVEVPAQGVGEDVEAGGGQRREAPQRPVLGQRRQQGRRLPQQPWQDTLLEVARWERRAGHEQSKIK